MSSDFGFQAFAERKEAEARLTALAPWVTAADHHDEHHRAVGNPWSRALFDGDFFLSPAPSPDMPSTSLVFVESREGNTVAKDPSTLGGGDTDKHLIYEGLSRVAADAVMAGAETIRGGRIVFSVWRSELVELRASLGLPRHPMQIVATLRGFNIDDTLLFNVPELRVILVTVASVSDAMHRALSLRPWITPVIMKDPADLPSAFRQIRRLGVVTISCVGGRTIARQLIDAGLIQDLYVTKSPKPGGEPGTPIHPQPIKGDLIARKRGTGADAGVVFEHVQLRSFTA